MDIFFSVIIPTLNEEMYLPHLLHDLERQNKKNFEIIVVDAHSTDKTLDQISNFSRLPITVLNSKKRNVSYQRNLGAQHAKGNYLIFLDADANIPVSFIRTVEKEINKHKYLIFIPSISPQPYTYEDHLLFSFANMLIEASQYLSKPMSAGGSIIIWNDYFHFIGGFNDHLFIAEDHEILQRAKKSGINTKFLRDITVKFSMRRMQREGRLKVFSKYALAILILLSKGKIENKIYTYDMGGVDYKAVIKKQQSSEKYKKLIERLKKYASFS